MPRVALPAFVACVVACSPSSSSPSSGGLPDAATDGPSAADGPSATDAASSMPDAGSDGGGAYGAACDSQYTDGCSSTPGPGTFACGQDPTHCCQTRRGCANGLTCIGATCSIPCSTASDCKALTPTAACVFVFSSSTLEGCFEPCPDAGSCPGGLVCRTTTPVATCEQYVMSQ